MRSGPICHRFLVFFATVSFSRFLKAFFNDIVVDASIIDQLSPEQKCCMNNKVPSKCLEMCVVTHDSDSRSLINEDSILKYCNPFWDTIGRCRKAEPGIFLDISLIL